jgi:hypothetical protein
MRTSTNGYPNNEGQFQRGAHYTESNEWHLQGTGIAHRVIAPKQASQQKAADGQQRDCDSDEEYDLLTPSLSAPRRSWLRMPAAGLGKDSAALLRMATPLKGQGLLLQWIER